MTNNILRFWQDGPEDSFHALFETAPILMQSTDRNGILTNVSSFWAEKLGFSRDEMIGHRATQFLTDASRKQAEEIDLPSFLETSRTFNVEYDFLRKNGDILSVQQSMAAQFSPKGHHLSSLAIMHDMSDVKALYADLCHTQRMQALGQLVGGAAHDFNNILTVIKGNAEFLKEDPDHSRWPDYLRDILNASERGASLAQLLLSYGQKSRLAPVPTDLNKTIRDLETMLRHVIPNKLDISIVTSPGLWDVHLDPHRFETVLINLVNNARDAMPKGGKITIETCNVEIAEDFVAMRGEDIQSGRYVMLAVSDTGDGIQSDIAPNIFEPYFTTKSVGSGSGLGLSMVFGFVKQSGGMIRFLTEVGFGTTFKLYFPAIKCPVNKLEIANQTNEIVAKPRPMFDILLVEDDPDVRRVLAGQIENGGYSVSQAASGDAALTLLLTGYRPKLLVTDIIMPGTLQGPELAGKARELVKDLKVVFVSGMPYEAMIHKDAMKETDLLITKPYEAEILIREISNLMS